MPKATRQDWLLTAVLSSLDYIALILTSRMVSFVSLNAGSHLIFDVLLTAELALFEFFKFYFVVQEKVSLFQKLNVTRFTRNMVHDELV